MPFPMAGSVGRKPGRVARSSNKTTAYIPAQSAGRKRDHHFGEPHLPMGGRRGLSPRRCRRPHRRFAEGPKPRPLCPKPSAVASALSPALAGGPRRGRSRWCWRMVRRSPRRCSWGSPALIRAGSAIASSARDLGLSHAAVRHGRLLAIAARHGWQAAADQLGVPVETLALTSRQARGAAPGLRRRGLRRAAVPRPGAADRPASPAPCAGLQPRQLHAHAGDAKDSAVVVADQPAREADQDRREGGEPWQVRDLPDRRGRGIATDVRGHPVADRPATGTARASMSGSGVGRHE
jgi:hypothetical protein